MERRGHYLTMSCRLSLNYTQAKSTYVCKPVQNSCILRLLKLSGVSRRTVLRANPVFEQLYLSHVKTLKMTGSNYFYGRKFYFISCMSLEFINGYVCRYLAPRESN